jgi:hypothetical protein
MMSESHFDFSIEQEGTPFALTFSQYDARADAFLDRVWKPMPHTSKRPPLARKYCWGNIVVPDPRPLNYRPKWMDRRPGSQDLIGEPTAGLPLEPPAAMQIRLVSKRFGSLLPARIIADLLDVIQDVIGLVGRKVMEAALGDHWNGIQFELPPVPRNYFPVFVPADSFRAASFAFEMVFTDIRIPGGEGKEIRVSGGALCDQVMRVLSRLQDSTVTLESHELEVRSAMELFGAPVLTGIIDQIEIRRATQTTEQTDAAGVLMDKTLFERLRDFRRAHVARNEKRDAVAGVITNVDLGRGTFALKESSSSHIVGGTFGIELQSTMCRALNRETRVWGVVELSPVSGAPVHVRAVDVELVDAGFGT